MASSSKASPTGAICMSSSPGRSTPPTVWIFKVFTTPSMGAMMSVCDNKFSALLSFWFWLDNSSSMRVNSVRVSCKYLFFVAAIRPSISVTWRLARKTSSSLTSPLFSKLSFISFSCNAMVKASCMVRNSSSSERFRCL